MGRDFFPPVSRKQQRGKNKDTIRREAARCPLPPGKRYGFLRVLRRAKKPKAWGLAVLCRCDCGTELAVRTLHLETGVVRDCGKGKHYRAREDRAPSDERVEAQRACDRAERVALAELKPYRRPAEPDIHLQPGWMQ